MTESELRTKVARFLDAYKGIKEGSTAHKELVDMFNNSGLCTRYKMTVSDAWCAMAVSDAFINTNLTDIFPCVECSCSKMVELASKAGIWTEDDSHTPKIGDVILYDWDDSGSGDNAGDPDHVGIVQTISGNSFTVIEGNKSNTVGVRDMTINGKYIRGYITPDYASAASGSTSATKTVDELAQEVIAGKWGNDPDRSASLTAAGYDAQAVQDAVNAIYGVGTSTASKADSASAGSATASSTSVKAAQSYESGYSKGKSYKVTATSGLNMRYGPGTGYSVIKALAYGSKVTYYGYYDKDSDGTKWLLVIANGETGWVCSTYLG